MFGGNFVRAEVARKEGKEGKRRRRKTFNTSLVINLTSTFLYMANYYVVGPTSSKYMRSLGGNEAWAGFLIGMTPLFALVSALVYSTWTNKTFKAPLVFSAATLICGNFLYAGALKEGSIAMVLAGRAMTGLGGPRGINRRYIADTTTVEGRTKVSAAFVACGGLGMAVGPGLAVFLEHFDFKVEIRGLGVIWFNGMTGPGYIMGIAWTLYALVLLVAFKEPKRNYGSHKSKKGTGEEGQSLLGSSPDDDKPPEKKKKSGFLASFVEAMSLINLPVILTIGLLFINKFVTEETMSSANIIGKSRFGWDVADIGSLSAGMGMLVVPLTIAVGTASRWYEDRFLLKYLLRFATIGVLLLIDFSQLFRLGIPYANMNPWRREVIYFTKPGTFKYVLGNVIVFCGLQASESVTMSTLSKVVSPELAAGTFNSGLLATEMGTLGRALGDAYIAVAGMLDLEGMLNLLFVPALILLAGCLVAIERYFKVLAC